MLYKTVALFPAGMLVCYLLLMLYFRSKGGYKVVLLNKKEIPETGVARYNYEFKRKIWCKHLALDFSI